MVYALMSFGGFLGLGKRLHPLPWPLLVYDPERAGYVVPLDQAALESAPSYEPEELRRLGGAPDYRAVVYEYYARYGGPLQ